MLNKLLQQLHGIITVTRKNRRTELQQQTIAGKPQAKVIRLYPPVLKRSATIIRL